MLGACFKVIHSLSPCSQVCDNFSSEISISSLSSFDKKKGFSATRGYFDGPVRPSFGRFSEGIEVAAGRTSEQTGGMLSELKSTICSMNSKLQAMERRQGQKRSQRTAKVTKRCKVSTYVNTDHSTKIDHITYLIKHTLLWWPRRAVAVLGIFFNSLLYFIHFFMLFDA